MSKGKNLMLCAGIITLIATFALSWFTIGIHQIFYVYGIGGLKNFLDLFVHTQNYADYYELPLWAIYILAAILIIILISGALQCYSIKKPVVGLIGSIIPLLIGIIILLNAFFGILPELIKYLEIFANSSRLIPGLIPFNYVIPGRTESIGTYVLLAGGVLGIIGYKISRDEF